AHNERAVAMLRSRKYREDKPFAIMCPNSDVAARYCVMGEEEKALLQEKDRPILIMKKRQGTSIAPSVAPYQNTLGVMLPYTPLHHLLFEQDLTALVMTSGNVSDEPIAYKDEEALRRLKRIADYFLLHNREIYMRCDDSVLKLFRGEKTFLRRARGYVPFPIRLSHPGGSVLACGAMLKNTFCLTKGNYAFVSHHIGDLENLETLRAFETGIAHFQRLFQIEPEAVAYDLHPDYLSTRYALSLEGLPKIGVQHHHAHALSCMAEYGLEGPLIGVTMDGTGYGEDETVWGGEFLAVELTRYRRLGHLRTIPMPGGEKAIKEPWRMAASYLQRIFGDQMWELEIEFIKRLPRDRWEVLKGMIQRGINAPLTSSAGRLFDAVSALLGIRDEVNYEGQAAIELEMIAAQDAAGVYPFTIREEEKKFVVDPDPLILAIVDELKKGVPAPLIATRFHRTLAQIIGQMCCRIRERYSMDQVVLSGGVFQNHLLLNMVWDLLVAEGFRPFVHHKVPPNDGGISLGQALYARQRLQEGLSEADVPAE
ncbi:MAG: carbamoyltransferase HypF, partial [Deltaproteobacteria bacterium]